MVWSSITPFTAGNSKRAAVEACKDYIMNDDDDDDDDDGNAKRGKAEDSLGRKREKERVNVDLIKRKMERGER